MYTAKRGEKDALYESNEKALLFFNWEDDIKYRPLTSFRLCFGKSAFFAEIKTNETDIRAEYTKTNEPVYEDSCMELFFAPYGINKGYINIECNPNSTYLSEFGTDKYNRVYLNTLTNIEPVICSNVTKNGWNVNIEVPYSIVNEVFKTNFSPENCDFYLAVFKCGDKTAKPHYLSSVKMGELPPGFHNPACFEKVEIK